MDTILEMRGIQKSFGAVKALNDVNLRVRQGEIHAICGENGAGKST
jgi:putative multiple sugar transport system ATP-binding protein